MKTLKNKIIKSEKAIIFGILAMTFLVFSVVFSIPNEAKAQTPPLVECLSGWAWSGYNSGREGVGWISLSAANPGSLGGTYEVKKNPNDDLVGYAWSSNVGWIKFGGLSSFPSNVNANPTHSNNARIEDGNKLTGWARACSVFVSNCDGALQPDYYRGGWDGWINLRENIRSSQGQEVGVDYNPANNELSNFAWGSNILGWLGFRGSNYGVVLASDTECLNGGGNNSFDYNASVNPVSVTPPATGSGIVSAQSSLDVSPLAGTPEDVEIKDFILKPGYALPSGVDAINFRKVDGPLCRGASCSLRISVDLDFDSSLYDPSVNNTIRFIVVVDNTITTNPPEHKDVEFNVVIIAQTPPSNTGNACTVNSRTVLVNQPVTWTAPSNNLGMNSPRTYTWYRPNNVSAPNPSIDTPVSSSSSNSTISQTYDVVGTINSYVQICEGGISCRESEVCNLQVIQAPIFQQI